LVITKVVVIWMIAIKVPYRNSTILKTRHLRLVNLHISDVLKAKRYHY